MRPLEDARDRMQALVGRAWDQAKSPLYRNAFFIMLASLIGAPLGFVFLFVVYKYYDLTDAGYAAAMVNTITFLVGIGSLGLPIALIRFLPESDDPPVLVNTSLSIAGGLSAALALVFILGLGIWAPNLRLIFANPVYLLIIPLTAMAYAFGPVLDQATIGVRRADLFAIRVAILSVIKIPLPLLFVLAFRDELGGTLGVYMSWSLSFAISVIVVGLVLLPRVIPGYRPRPRLSRSRLRPMFRFSVGNWVASLIGSAGSLLLTLLIINTLPEATGSTAVAVYYAVTVMAGILIVIPQATMSSLYAEASQRNAERRRDERRAIGLSIALLIPGIIAMWLFADVLLRLFENTTLADQGAGPLRILTLSSIPIFLNSVFGTRVRVRKEIIPLIVSAAIGSGVTLGLGYVLLQSYGLVGLAIAVVLGQAASTPYLLVVAGRPMEEEPMAAPIRVP
ncbi:MAG TPA: oligosaccharide flippase family protein [Thermoplasmata archaeon]|nr:oligosaccharide flippase family protein [Thermoplasmata archaeon]